MNENLVIIFTRNPKLGKVKTRLAKTIGNESALDVYKLLLGHTESVIRNIACDKAVYYSEHIKDNDIWKRDIYQKHLQKGNDLGERMLHAFKIAFEHGFKKAVIIGSDLIDLQVKHIEEAFQNLDTYDVAIGPAEDGGYYLLGMKSLHGHLFKGKKWGTSSVLSDTMHDLQNLDVFLLEELNDIDTYDDIKNNPKLNTILK